MSVNLEHHVRQTEAVPEHLGLQMPADPRVFQRKYARPPDRRLTIGFYESACVLLIAFVLAGSLYPFEFDFSLPLSRLQGLSNLPNRSDLIANWVLFVPLGLAAGMLRRRSAQIVAIAIGLLVAIACQLLQIYISSRTPAAWDVVLNTAGLLAGLLISRLVTHPIRRSDSRLSLASFIAISTFLGYQLAPFTPSLDIDLLQESLGRLLASPALSLKDFLTSFVYVFIVSGALKVELSTRNATRILLGVVATVILLKPITASATAQVSVAGLLGMALALYPAARLPSDRRVFGVLAFIALALYCYDGLTPLLLRPQLVIPGLPPLPTIINGNWLANFSILMWKSFLLIAAISLLFGSIGDETLMPMATVVCLTILVEGAQIFIASGTPSIIEIILAITLSTAFWRSIRSSSLHLDGYGRNDRLRKTHDRR